MKYIKNLLISVITVALSLIMLTGCMLTVFADEYESNFHPSALAAYNSQGYGSFEKGVVAPFTSYRFYHPSVQYGNPDVDGHPNLDFQKGWQYWFYSDTQVKINTDSTGNTYATMIGDKTYSGISTVRFRNSKIQTGDSIGILYKWRNKNHLRAVEASLIELHNVNNKASDWETITAAGNDGRGNVTIWTVDEEDDEGWNIALARCYNKVKEPTGSVPIVYFSAAIQSTTNPDVFKNTDIDDLQIVKVSESSGIVSTLDNETLYNLNNLPKLEQPDYIFGSEHKDPDPDADIKVNVNDLLSGKVDLNESVDDTKEENKDTSSNKIATWIWIVIAVGVVLLLAAAAVVVIIFIKKKKANVTTEE